LEIVQKGGMASHVVFWELSANFLKMVQAMEMKFGMPVSGDGPP